MVGERASRGRVPRSVANRVAATACGVAGGLFVVLVMLPVLAVVEVLDGERAQ
jgi:hypothetical protein